MHVINISKTSLIIIKVYQSYGNDKFHAGVKGAAPPCGVEGQRPSRGLGGSAPES